MVRFVSESFDDNKEPTIGAAFLTKRCQVNDRVVKLEIWDTAGQERFHSLAPMYYRNASAAVVVYDITKSSSLARAKEWVNELQKQASSDLVICLVGNKLDLVQGDRTDGDESTLSPREVPTEEGKQYAEANNLHFFEASAKTGANVAEIFYTIAKDVKAEPVQKPSAGQSNSKIRLGQSRATSSQTDRACSC